MTRRDFARMGAGYHQHRSTQRGQTHGPYFAQEFLESYSSHCRHGVRGHEPVSSPYIALTCGP
ncbi:MAG TPA: hypothetical protein VGF96_02410 [Terracidiphilus sp.]